jgi:GT2 family glycosyltransferase
VLPSTTVLAELARELDRHPEAAVAQPRALDPTGRPAPSRWVPTPGGRHADRPGVAVVFWEGVFVIRRSAFDAVGAWPGHFFYGHEGIDLAWRLWDAGWEVRYAPDVVVHHPATSPTRHAVYYRLNARNRVWIARRNLPLPVAVAHLLVWTLLTVARVRSPGPLRTWFAGFWEGLTTPCGRRRPIRWRTVWRMTRAGRPPLL